MPSDGGPELLEVVSEFGANSGNGLGVIVHCSNGAVGSQKAGVSLDQLELQQMFHPLLIV